MKTLQPAVERSSSREMAQLREQLRIAEEETRDLRRQKERYMATITQKERMIQERNNTTEENRRMLEQKDNTLREKDSYVAKDAIHEKDALVRKIYST